MLYSAVFKKIAVLNSTIKYKKDNFFHLFPIFYFDNVLDWYTYKTFVK